MGFDVAWHKSEHSDNMLKKAYTKCEELGGEKEENEVNHLQYNRKLSLKIKIYLDWNRF